ncbi:hypothetical protein [Schnuerera ultunensis]|uniref:Uncharacterized protein n=1 Tax=[Clostridium] ultunense Esp TaxID=1288971 RepID=A0A1M4PSR3_9FIRM|nr:hypothetical protein [Schnuerera ultunensis]SHD78514.1 conserved membrane protein of unknown function [[Clostridium] ultunense Esp]
MNLFEDIILVNKSTFKKSIKSFSKNWFIIFTGIVYVLLNIAMIFLVSTLFSGILSILAGLMIAIVSSSLISNYLYLLFNIVNYDRITWDNFKEGFKYFLWKVYGIFFIAWIGSFVLSSIGGILGTNAEILSRVVSIVIIVGLNPLPETIYQKYLSSGESIRYAFEFMKDNWINWVIPNVLFYFILYLITNTWAFSIFTTHLSFNFNFTLKDVGLYILGQGLFSFIMIYRGHLFKLLSTSTPRKRMYMNKFYN